MQKTIQVQVPRPCHESWNQMTETDKGRFCMSCRKEVIDFSIMTDQQVLSHMANAAGGVCGRFKNEQLNRDITERKEKELAWYKYFIHVMIPALLMTNKSSAQERITGDTIVCTRPKDSTSLLTGKVDIRQEIRKHEAITIEGKITDEKLQPISGATIIIKGTRNGVASDMNGEFTILINKDIYKPILAISYIGFEQKEFHIDINKAKDNTIKLSAVLKQTTTGLGEVVVVGYTVARKKENKNLSQKIKDTLSSYLAKDTVKVYPNPVSSGSVINIDFDVKNTGEYEMNVINISGQSFIREKIILNSKKHVEQISCDNKIKPGIYFIEIVNPINKKMYINKILVQ
jgi:carboxypeptidase-like protein/type IX secretion system substrate protein